MSLSEIIGESLIWIKVTFNPAFWIRNYGYNKNWDEKIKRLIKENAQVYLKNRHVATLGDETIWIGNYPYAFGHPYEPHDMGILASRRTIYRLNKYIWEKHWNIK